MTPVTCRVLSYAAVFCGVMSCRAALCRAPFPYRYTVPVRDTVPTTDCARN